MWGVTASVRPRARQGEGLVPHLKTSRHKKTLRL